MKKKSLILQLFFVLFIIFLCLIAVLSFSTYKFAESVILKEAIQLNANVLQQMAIRIEQELQDVEDLAGRIAYDTRIIRLLEKGSKGESVTGAQVQEIEGIMAGYIWTSKNMALLVDAHLIDSQGHTYSTSYSMSSNLEDLEEYSRVLENAMDRTVLPVKSFVTSMDGSAYFFQVIRTVKAYISQQNYGFLLLNVSEKLLRDNYIRLTSEEKDFFIVDSNGVIISHSDKNRINQLLVGFAKESDLSKPDNYYLMDDRLYIFRRIGSYDWYIVEAISLTSALQPLQKIQLFLTGFGLLCITLTAVALGFAARKIAEPLALLTGKMKEFSKGDLSVQIPDSTYREFAQLSVSFNELISQVNNLLEENVLKERQKRLLEFDFLQAQISPHFIHNTLSSIRFYVEMGKNKEAEEMLYHFSKLLRRVLTPAGEFVSLREEIAHLEDYLALQKMRYAGAFTVEFKLDENTLDVQIPSFIIQPIIENAIFHGLQANRMIRIEVKTEMTGEDLYITVQDNGIGISQEKIAEIFNKEVQMNKVGIINVHERIRILCGTAYGLTIEPNEPRGTRIILKLCCYV